MVAQVWCARTGGAQPPELPRVSAIGVDRTVFAFALGITALIGLVVGLIPALLASGVTCTWECSKVQQRTAGGHQCDAAHAGSRRGCAGTGPAGERGIAVAQPASACSPIDPGFDALPCAYHAGAGGRTPLRHRQSPASAVLQRRLWTQFARFLASRAAAFTSQLPLSGDFEILWHADSRMRSSDGDTGFRYAVSPGLFRDHATFRCAAAACSTSMTWPAHRMAVLISESFAKRKFADQDPLGQRVRIGPDIGHANRAVGHDCGSGGRREADFAGAERFGCFLHLIYAVVMGRQCAVAGGPHSR